MTTPAARPSFASLIGRPVRVKVVDIGANPLDGDPPPYVYMLAAGDADVIGFEPNAEVLEQLQAIKGPTETYLPHAIADGRRHTLRYCFAPGMTSLLEPNQAVLGLFHGFPSWGRVTGTEEIDTSRLDDIPETAGVDMIKIDIQGAELMAFQGGLQRLKTALVIHTEVEFLPMYVGQPLFSEVELFLRGHGFMLHKFHPVVSRVMRPLFFDGAAFSGLGQLVWADAIFVRDFTRLAELTDEQLLKMAALLHDCYGSSDLVGHLLAEHDKRGGGQLSPAYLEATFGPDP
jgi:FkbM family methyltransferase